MLKNAVKFTAAGGEIVIESLSDGKDLLLKISDTGIGMLPEELTRAFSAFSQGDHVRQESHRFGGLGLGLTISQRLAEMHSGRIHAASEGRGKGSTFTIQLPLAKIPDEGLSAEDSKELKGPATKNELPRGTRILLVEDHEPTRNALTHLLMRRHYKILAAGTIAEARAIAGREKIDLVISDIGPARWRWK